MTFGQILLQKKLNKLHHSHLNKYFPHAIDKVLHGSAYVNKRTLEVTVKDNGNTTRIKCKDFEALEIDLNDSIEINDFSEYPKELLSLIEVDDLITKKGGDCIIDLFQLDLSLERLPPEYDRHECTYQDKENISICEIIKIIYGGKGIKLIESLI